MTKRMLIDSTHAEETRVVVLDGNRLEDFDVETSTKQQLKGNIYLAKVVRVEPSLQAAFVEYGGNRHGFLAFGEIHPDYYQIPVADRQRLLEMQEAEAREEEEAEDRAAARDAQSHPDQTRPSPGLSSPAAFPTAQTGRDIFEAMDAADRPASGPASSEPADPAPDPSAEEPAGAEPLLPETAGDLPRPDQIAQAAAITQDIVVAPHEAEALFPEIAAPTERDDAPEDGVDMAPEAASIEPDPAPAKALPSGDHAATNEPATDGPATDGPATDAPTTSAIDGVAPPDGLALGDPAVEDTGFEPAPDFLPDEPPPEAMGGEADDSREQRPPPRFLRNYKIQEVIRRRQILLIQVVKEERGTKGAALTTYISLAGRFSVLMPNSPRGGGISRKITSAADRRRLKEVTAELDLPRGMGLIVRTAGANRPKPEIIRDCEYLLNQWDQIRELTMKSVAPALIYEEASLIKRAIRDVYSRDVDDILVDGEQGWRAARDFMRMLMPTHARKVQLWKDPQPLFVKAQVEAQLDAMLMPTVQLKSGGYLVINQTEALVAIDVNSGRSTRERGIEETALKTNLEAADEAARQLRLRDLAGLIVIDFIDMESRRNNTAVEARLKAALKNDRARIQLGSISHFGLLEMSRQRLRPSLAETSFVMCAHCGGTGQVRSTESAALHVLRGIEEEGAKRRAAEVIVHVAGSIALYVLNHKRVRLGEIEARYGMKVAFAADDTLLPPMMRIDRVRAQAASELPAPISQLAPPEPFDDPDEEPIAPDARADVGASDVAAADVGPDDTDEDDAPRPGETAAETEQRSKRRRRRRRGGRREDGDAAAADVAAGPATDANGAAPGQSGALQDAEPSDEDAPGDAAQDRPIAPSAEAEAAGDDAERSKRRGRRGGRRRRREPTDGADAETTEQLPAESGTAFAAPPAYSAPLPAAPASPPPYAGPTPANPFGGASAFDIFDAIEQAEQERALAATSAPRRTPDADPPEPELPDLELPDLELPDPLAAAPGEPADSTANPEPVIAEPIALAPETVSIGEPEPALDPVPEPPAHAALPDQTTPNEPTAAEPVADAPTAPVIAPTIIDGTEALAEKKRGWWRR